MQPKRRKGKPKANAAKGTFVTSAFPSKEPVNEMPPRNRKDKKGAVACATSAKQSFAISAFLSRA